MSIAETETKLVALLGDCLDTVDVAAGPGEWDGGYLQKMLSSLPAVRVVFGGSEDVNTSSTFLSMRANWIVYVITGWKGGDERSRRIGTDAAYAIIQRALAVLHNERLMEDNGVDTLTLITVQSVENLWSSAWDLTNVAIYAITCTTDCPIDPLLAGDCKEDLADFRKANFTFDLPGVGVDAPDIEDAGTAGDLPGQAEIPQT